MKYLIITALIGIIAIGATAQKETTTCGNMTLPAHQTEEAIDDFRLQGCTKFIVTDAEEWTRPRYVTIESFTK